MRHSNKKRDNVAKSRPGSNTGYTIIYIWRMLEGQVPCINSLRGGANVIWHIRRGRECQIPCINHHSPRNIQALKHATLPVRGQLLFNTLLRDTRNMTGCKVDMFKRRLDNYLSTIPDETQVLGYTAQRRADLNSFWTLESLSMPTGHLKWKCLVPEIRPAEEVALTALLGHSDAQRYYQSINHRLLFCPIQRKKHSMNITVRAGRLLKRLHDSR